MSRLPVILRRLLAITILLTLISCVWILIALPIAAAFYERQSTIDDLLDRLGRLQVLAKQAKLLRIEQASAVRSMGSSDLLTGSNFAIVGAELQSRLQKYIVNDGGGLVQRISSLSPLKEDRFTRVAVAVDFEIRSDGLTPLLYAVLTEAQSLFIDELEITVVEAEPMVSIHMVVFGFMPGNA